MTNKDKILRYLECGLKVEAINNNRCLKHTIYWYNDIDNQYVTAVWLSDIDYLEEYTLTPIPTKPNYKPGDLVTILPIARESDGYNDWCQEKKDMIDLGTYEIQDESNGICWVYNKDKSEYFYFPAWAVAPAFADEVAEIEKAEKLKILCELEARMEQIKKEIEALKK